MGTLYRLCYEFFMRSGERGLFLQVLCLSKGHNCLCLPSSQRPQINGLLCQAIYTFIVSALTSLKTEI